MATFLFDKIIFGPVKSRRLGLSLGINLLPNDLKFCTFDCIYCECGWTFADQLKKAKLHPADEVKKALESQLQNMKSEGQIPDNITFAGNGEPTTHPEFPMIIEDTIKLRDTYFPNAKISVLSNATQIHKQKIVDALNRIDQNILKLDAVFDDLFNLINRPQPNFTASKVIENLKKFDGNLIIQTMFIRGEYQGVKFDNTKAEHITAWIEKLIEINPKKVMIYPIERDTPTNKLEKISKQELETIATQVRSAGLNVDVF